MSVPGNSSEELYPEQTLGEHPHSTAVSPTVSTQQTASERPCPTPCLPVSEQGEPLSRAQACKLGRFADIRIAGRLSRCTRNACALPYCLFWPSPCFSTPQWRGQRLEPSQRYRRKILNLLQWVGPIKRGVHRKECSEHKLFARIWSHVGAKAAYLVNP